MNVAGSSIAARAVATGVLSISIAIVGESSAYYYLNYDFTRWVLSLRTSIVCMTLIDHERHLNPIEHLVNLYQIQDLLKHTL